MKIMSYRFLFLAIFFHAVLLVFVVILGVVVGENERNNFELFIESMNNYPIRVYAVTREPRRLRIVAHNELATEEKEKFIRFLSSLKEIPPPSAGRLYYSYDFQIHQRVGESKVKTWDIDVRINQKTELCQFWITTPRSFGILHYSALDERLSEEFRNYLASLDLED